MEYPISLYCDTEATVIGKSDRSHGADDYRKMYVVDDGHRRLVIKHISNTFSDRRRIEGWFRLMEEYRRNGIYCPPVVTDLNGELLHRDTAEGRDYYTYAEEYAAYETAEHIGIERLVDGNGYCRFMPDVMRSLGKIASARLDVMDWGSGYCLLQPFCAPDTTDEATECANAFVQYIREKLPRHLPRAEALLKIFIQCREDVRRVYPSLPTSCFQADLNNSNILLDQNNSFVGLIDFNLSGKEPILNYTVREALWAAEDKRLFGENDSRLYFYEKELDSLRDSIFLKNTGYIGEYYRFNESEKQAFPILFRYINSFWWHHLSEIKLIGEDDWKIMQLLDWLEYQMTRDDIRLP